MQRHATVATTTVLAAPASPDAQLVEEPAAVLRRAEAERVVVAPLTDEYDDLDLAGAYAVQAADVRIRLTAGEHLVGRTVGRTSVPMREQLGLPEAGSGTLFQSMVIPDGGTIGTRELITPRAEAEVGLILGRRLSGPRVTSAEVRAAVSHVAPVVEIIDSRVADWRVSQADTVAGTASSARVALGRPVDATDDLLPKSRSAPVHADRGGLRPRGPSATRSPSAYSPTHPSRSPVSVHMNARRTTSPRGRRSARPIRPEEAQR
jgi:2-keto-4-pentenoate hydratase